MNSLLQIEVVIGSVFLAGDVALYYSYISDLKRPAEGPIMARLSLQIISIANIIQDHLIHCVTPKDSAICPFRLCWFRINFSF